MSKTTTPTLQHAEWCKTERIETADYADRGITTTHCLDCGAHEAKDRHGKTLQTPAVTGALHMAGRGDMDVTIRRATPQDVMGLRPFGGDGR
jgi:hypothetical protein